MSIFRIIVADPVQREHFAAELPGAIEQIAGHRDASIPPPAMVIESKAVPPSAPTDPSPSDPADQAAIVRIGGAGPADLTLPADATVRETALAVSLLSEILNLREERAANMRAQNEYWQLAHADPLTGIPNRRAWDKELERRLRSADHAPITLGLLDLDGFKQINDQCGHPKGDEVLKATAAALAHGIRTSGDFVARVGGDEFGVLLANCKAASGVLERLRDAIAANCSGLTDRSITASVGYAHSEPGDTPAALLQRADENLLEAKRLRRR